MEIRRFCRCIAALACLLPAAAAFGLDKPEVAKKKYEAYVARVKAGDLSLDWRDFRLVAKIGGVDGDFDQNEARDLVLAQLRNGDSATALVEAQKMIDHNMARAEGHLLAMMAYKKLQRPADAAQQKTIVDDLVKSIMSPGDGRSPAQAWFVVDVDEEYFVLGAILGLDSKGQGLVHKDGHSYDEMTVVDAKGAESVIWFNTDTDMEVLSRALGK